MIIFYYYSKKSQTLRQCFAIAIRIIQTFVTTFRYYVHRERDVLSNIFKIFSRNCNYKIKRS